MQVNAPFPPPNPNQQFSPASTGSEWSGMNGYQQHQQPPAQRPDNGFRAPSRVDSMTPSDNFNPPPPYRSQTYAHSPTESTFAGRNGHGSRASSRAGSIAGSRSSDGNFENPRSRNYQRMESELRQHYAVLKAYLRGAAQQPRPNKARDKLLRLSPVQFHELSTDVFDELQRRQAAAPLPGRPPRQDKVPQFLQPRPDFHEKRNQARQKLSSLQTSRFRDLSTDVFCELERRFPHFNPDNKRESTRSNRSNMGRPPGPNGFGPPSRSHTANPSMSSNAGFPPRKGSIAHADFGGPNERPTQKQFQSNTITPNKSTMVEDEDDEDEDHHGPGTRYERSSDAFGLESVLTSPRSNRDTSATSLTGGSRDIRSHPPPDELHEKMHDLQIKLNTKDEELSVATEQNHTLEQKLADAERLSKELQNELDSIQSDKANMERELRSQLAAQSGGDGGPWREKHEQLERQYQALQEQHQRQSQTTDEVSKQFKAQLAEMREMADMTGGHAEREQQLHQDRQKLEEEVKEWKSRYIKAKTALRLSRASHISPQALRAPAAGALGGPAFNSPDGLVQDVHVTRFQLAIDELLAVARSSDSQAVLDHMKSIVTAVRGITGDVETATAQTKTDDATSKRRNKLKAKVSATANNLITATRNFAAAAGLSPVSLLDAAASHLTAAVVDLLKAVQIRPSSSNELQDDPEAISNLTPVNNAGYFNINIAEDLRRRSGDSVYSAISDPPDHTQRTPTAHEHNPLPHINGFAGPNGLGISTSYGLSQDEQDLEDLKVYVGNQTDTLVTSIQSLVTSIRNEDPLPVIRNRATSIADIAENILGATEGSIEEPSSFSSSLADQTSHIVQQLSQSKRRLEQVAIDSQAHDNQSSAREFCQGFPPLAFQIAREAKELVGRVEGVYVGDTGGDDGQEHGDGEGNGQDEDFS